MSGGASLAPTVAKRIRKKPKHAKTLKNWGPLCPANAWSKDSHILPKAREKENAEKMALRLRHRRFLRQRFLQKARGEGPPSAVTKRHSILLFQPLQESRDRTEATKALRGDVLSFLGEDRFRSRAEDPSIDCGDGFHPLFEIQ